MQRWSTLFSGFLLFGAFFRITAATPTTTTKTTTEDRIRHEQSALEEIARRYTRRTAHGVHLPLVLREAPGAKLERRGQAAAIGLGDYFDLAYSVLLTVGEITTPLILDTGSSDLWVMSDACTSGCRSSGINVPLYPQATFKSTGLEAQLFYGDSASGTSAFGTIGRDIVSLADLTLKDQFFAAINKTNTSLIQTSNAGIFGLGFPVNSVIWSELFTQQVRNSRSVTAREEAAESVPPSRDQDQPRPHPSLHRDVKYGNRFFPNLHFRSRFPSSLPDILNPDPRSPSSSNEHQYERRQVSSGMLALLDSFSSIGPLLSRLVVGSDLQLPMFAVTLQRNTIDVGGNAGMLSIGEMPAGVKLDELTWVPVRTYSYTDGGLPAPPSSPDEQYPIAWEVLIDDVYLDGQKLPRSSLTSQTIALSALVDTGNSLVRGPQDIVQEIYSRISGSPATSRVDARFPCSEPHTLSFSIGGKQFPLDPRDFATQVFVDDVTVCAPNLVSTDPPASGSYLFSWSLGAPFLKSVLSAYYFGNLTYPSKDRPRIGFLSTVPANASDLMKAAVASAARADHNFPMLSVAAPSGTFRAAGTDAHGVPTAAASGKSSSSATSSHRQSIVPLLALLSSLAVVFSSSCWHLWTSS